MERSRHHDRDTTHRAAGPRRRRSPRSWIALGATVVAGSSLAVAGATSAGAASSGSAANPSGVLKYGVDLNDTFSNTFDPAASTDDCSYTEYTGLYDSLLAPGNTAVSPLLAASYTDTPTSITFHLRPGATPTATRSPRPPWRPASTTSRPARSGSR
jgi:ABC-type oligopeptide transport system substrate-binding subunit